MSVPRQQRTRSRRRFNPAAPPLPEMLRLVSIDQNGPAGLVLTFSQPVVLSGVPVVLLAGSIPAGNFGLSPDGAVIMDFPSPFGGAVLISWDPLQTAWRGPNGEWLPGGYAAAGAGLPGELPQLVPITQVQQNSSDVVTVTLGGDATGLSLATDWATFDAGGRAVFSVVELTPAIYELTLDAAITSNAWGIGAWAVYSRLSNVWIAPGNGTF